jgi:hypothetical protein
MLLNAHHAITTQTSPNSTTPTITYLQQRVAVAVGQVVLQSCKARLVAVGEVKLLKAHAALRTNHQSLVALRQQRPALCQSVLQYNKKSNLSASPYAALCTHHQPLVALRQQGAALCQAVLHEFKSNTKGRWHLVRPNISTVNMLLCARITSCL